MEEALIEYVRLHPCLYDVNSKYYRDPTMRQAAWEDVGQNLNKTADQAREAWIKLRNAYLAAVKRRKTKSGQALAKFAMWKYEKEMSFLLPFFRMRATPTNFESDTSMDEQIKQENYEEEIQLDDDTMEYEPAFIKERQIFEKSANHSPEMTRMNQNSSAGGLRVTHISLSGSNFLDEVDMFYLSMARTVKTLPRVEQVKIRMELCQLVSKAELRVMEAEENQLEHLSTLNEPSSQPSLGLAHSGGSEPWR